MSDRAPVGSPQRDTETPHEARERFPRPSVMGVVNVTPDSFSDGGVNLDAADAIASARRMAADGAARRRRRRRVDAARLRGRLGRGGAAARACRCSRRVAGELAVSIDTAKAEVARAAIDLGAELVNDVTALRGDPELAEVVAERGAYLCLMHMRGEPRTMQADPRYDDVASEVDGLPRGAPAHRGRRGDPRGADLSRPGDRLRQDAPAQLRARAPARRAARAGTPGRDRLLAQALARAPARRPGRDDGVGCSQRRRSRGRLRAGATILRVHDVREHVEALAAAQAVADPEAAAAAPP